MISLFGANLGPTPEKCDRERCRLDHHSSPFRRVGAIQGVPDASRAPSFDLTPRPSHLMTFMRSQVSSRNLTLILIFERVPRARRSVSVDMNGPRDTIQQLTLRQYIIRV